MFMKFITLIAIALLPNMLVANDLLFDKYLENFKKLGVQFDERPHVQIYVYDLDLLNTCNGPIIPYINKTYPKNELKNVLILTGVSYNNEIEKTILNRYGLDKVLFVDQFSNPYLALSIKTHPVKYHIDFKKKKILADFGMSMSEVQVTEFPFKIIDTQKEATDISFINKNILHIGFHNEIDDFVYLTDANNEELIIIDKSNVKNNGVIEINNDLIKSLITKGLIKDKIFLDFFENNLNGRLDINSVYRNDNILELILTYFDSKHSYNSIEYNSFTIALNLKGSEILSANCLNFDTNFKTPKTILKYDDKLIASLSTYKDSIKVNGVNSRIYGILAIKNINSNENIYFDELDGILDKNTASAFKGFYPSKPQNLLLTDKYIYYYNESEYPAFFKIPRNANDFSGITMPMPYGIIMNKFINSIMEIRRNALLNINSRTYSYATTPSVVSSDNMITIFSYINTIQTKIKVLYFTQFYDDNTQKEHKIILKGDNIIDCFLLSSNDKSAELLLKTVDNKWLLKTIEY